MLASEAAPERDGKSQTNIQKNGPTPSEVAQEAISLDVFFADPQEDPESRTHNSGVQYCYSVDYGAPGWILFLDSPRGLGLGSRGCR